MIVNYEVNPFARIGHVPDSNPRSRCVVLPMGNHALESVKELGAIGPTEIEIPHVPLLKPAAAIGN